GARRAAVGRPGVEPRGRRAAGARRADRHRPRSGLLVSLPGEPRAASGGGRGAARVRPAGRRGPAARRRRARARRRLSRGLRRRAPGQRAPARRRRRLRRRPAPDPRRVRRAALPVPRPRRARDVRRRAGARPHGRSAEPRLPRGYGGHRHAVARRGRARPRSRVPLLAGRAGQRPGGARLGAARARARARGGLRGRCGAGELPARALGSAPADPPAARARGRGTAGGRMTLTLVVGGTRSGKSARAEALAAASGQPVRYVATADATDESLRARIAEHAARRPAGWTTVELGAERPSLARALGGDDGTCVLIDGLGPWLGALLHRLDGGAREAALGDLDA